MTSFKGKDNISSVVWLVLSVIVLEESWTLPFGTLSQPKPGFFPIVLGTLLGLLSLCLFVKSRLGKTVRGDHLEILPERGGWRRIGLTLGGMFIFYLIFDVAGFLLATFLLILVLVRFVEPQRWSYALAVAVLISVGSYLLFQLLLKSNLPMGILAGL